MVPFLKNLFQMDSTTTLYFVRHGETEYNRKRIVQGRGIDAPLNHTGRWQARALAERFADTCFDAVYTSSLRRAIETASVILDRRKGTPVYSLEDLDEMAWGIYEGEPSTPEIEQVFAEFRAAWTEGCFDKCVDGGESILDVQSRALRAVRRIVNEHPGETLLVVTHGRFLRVLLCSILDGYDLADMQKMPHSNTCVNRIRCHGDVFMADSLNCVRHLEQFNQSM